MLALLEGVDLPVAVKTVAASGAAAAFRIFLMPVDAAKTIMQASAVGGPGLRLGAQRREGGAAGVEAARLLLLASRGRRPVPPPRRRAGTGWRPVPPEPAVDQWRPAGSAAAACTPQAAEPAGPLARCARRRWRARAALASCCRKCGWAGPSCCGTARWRRRRPRLSATTPGARFGWLGCVRARAGRCAQRLRRGSLACLWRQCTHQHQQYRFATCLHASPFGSPPPRRRFFVRTERAQCPGTRSSCV